MSKKRSVLDSLPRRRLIELGNGFNADFAPTTLNKDKLVDELARIRRTKLEDLLPELTREKQVIIDRILAGGNGHSEPAASTGNRGGGSATAGKKGSGRPSRGKSNGTAQPGGSALGKDTHVAPR